MLDKEADLAGPGIGDYDELEKILPQDYNSLLTPKETQKAIYAVKNYIEEHLCKELNLMLVSVPLIVDSESGVNDYLDRDGSRGPVQFHISNDHGKNPVDGEVVQAATKWKRMALKQFGMDVGEGVGADYTVIQVICDKTGEVVAVYRSNRVRAEMAGIDAYLLGAWYNFGLLGIERNGPGLATLAVCERGMADYPQVTGYPNLYYHTFTDRKTLEETRRLGWITNKATKIPTPASILPK